jgi:hypothetical protein
MVGRLSPPTRSASASRRNLVLRLQSPVFGKLILAGFIDWQVTEIPFRGSNAND